MSSLDPTPSAAVSGLESSSNVAQETPLHPVEGDALFGRWSRVLGWAVPLFLAVAGSVAFYVDLATERFFKGRGLRGELANLVDVCETFGNGWGAAVLLTAVYALERRRRWIMPRLIAATLAAGMAANVLKMMISRTRPNVYMQGESWSPDVWATFGDWFPLINHRTAAYQSFPSGHTAVAVGLALGLSWAYPQGRRLFAVLAVMVGVQRMYATMHFPSDVLFGAAVGWLCAYALLFGPLARRFDRIEKRLADRWFRSPESAEGAVRKAA